MTEGGWIHKVLAFFSHTNLIPFMFVLSQNGDEDGFRVRVSTARIIEGVIIAAIAGILAGYISVGKMEVKLADLKEHIDQTDNRVEKLYNDLYRPFHPEEWKK